MSDAISTVLHVVTKLDKLVCWCKQFPKFNLPVLMYCQKKYKLWRTPNVHVNYAQKNQRPGFTNVYQINHFKNMYMHVFLEILHNYIDIYRNLHNLAL